MKNKLSATYTERSKRTAVYRTQIMILYFIAKLKIIIYEKFLSSNLTTVNTNSITLKYIG